MARPGAQAAKTDAVRVLESRSKEELVRIIVDDAKNWLAHDGLWFQAVEAAHGMDAAIAADRAAWGKTVGLVEYAEFAKAIDPRLCTRCIACPPDPHGDDIACAWEFSLEKLSGRAGVA